MFGKFIEKWKKQDHDTFHFRTSVLKSAFRIAAGLALLGGLYILAGVGLIIAEVLGIAEEF